MSQIPLHTNPHHPKRSAYPHSHVPTNYPQHPKRRRTKRGKGRIVVLLLCIALVVSLAVAFVMWQKSEQRSAVEVPTQSVAPLTNQSLESDQPTVVQADDVVLTMNGSKDTYVLKGESYLEAGVHAVQKGVGVITQSVTIEGAVDASAVGDYEIVYTATTSTGAQAKTTRTVHVVDTMQKATSLPVMMYHYVYDEANPPAKIDSNFISNTALEQQLNYLQENSFYYPSFQEVRAFAEGTHSLPAKSVVLTFDDGEWGFLDYGVPLLNKYKVPGTSFVISNDGDILDKTEGMATEYVRFQSHSYGLHKAGSNVGRGGIIHALDASQIAADTDKAKAILGEVEAFAYPFGDNNETAHQALNKSGILCAFTIKNARVTPGSNPMALSRIRIQGNASLATFISLVS